MNLVKPGVGEEDPAERADAVVLEVDPGLGPLGTRHDEDAVLVTGSWLAGASTLSAALARRLPQMRIVEPEDLRPGRAPAVVVFVCSGIAPLTPSDCALIELAAANTEAVVAVVSKIDVHQGWRDVLDRDQRVLSAYNQRFDSVPWLGVSTRGDSPGLDELAQTVLRLSARSTTGERNRLRAWITRLEGMLHVSPEGDSADDARVAELRQRRQAALRRTRTSKSERTLTLRNRIAQARMTLQYFVRNRVGSVTTELREDIRDLRRRDVADFGYRARRRMAVVTDEVEEATEEHLAQVIGDVTQSEAQLRAAAVRPVPPVPSDPPVRSRRLETRMMALFGVFFGLGAAVTVFRLVAYLRPELAPVGLAGGLVAGACIAVWLVGVRGLLHDRAALERWLGEAMGNLRVYLEQWVAARVLEVETRLNSELVDMDERESERLAAQVEQIDAQLRDAAMNTARATALRSRDLPAVRKALRAAAERLDVLARADENESA